MNVSGSKLIAPNVSRLSFVVYIVHLMLISPSLFPTENCMLTLNLDRCDLIILGGMNVDLLLKPAYGCKLNMQILHNFMRSLDLSQIITEPTRITEQSKSLIDVILVNNQHRIVDSGVVPLSISDHSLIYCIVKAGVPKATPRTIEYRSYRGFDENAFIQDLNNVPWHIVDDENNVNDAVLTWNKLFTEVVDSHAPLKKRRVKGTTAPWMNNKMLKRCTIAIIIFGKHRNQILHTIGECIENCEIL